MIRNWIFLLISSIAFLLLVELLFREQMLKGIYPTEEEEDLMVIKYIHGNKNFFQTRPN